MTTHVATPYGPPVPGNPVYVAMPIVPGAWVVAYAPVFAYQSTADRSVYKVASGWTTGTSAVTAKWQLEGFVGIATMTAKGPAAQAGGQSSKRRKTDEANSCTVQVAGSVSVMVPKSQTPTPGRWCTAVTTGLSIWDGQSQPVEVATVREASAVTGSAIGVCLAVAPDQCSITLLLRRDAYQSELHYTATHQSRTVAGRLASSGPGEPLTSVKISNIAQAVVHCTEELATLDNINTMLTTEATALEVYIGRLAGDAQPAAMVEMKGFKEYSDAVNDTNKQLKTAGKPAGTYLTEVTAAAGLATTTDTGYTETGEAKSAGLVDERAALEKKAGPLPNLVRVLTGVVASTATEHHLPTPSQLTALKDTLSV